MVMVQVRLSCAAHWATGLSDGSGALCADQVLTAHLVPPRDGPSAHFDNVGRSRPVSPLDCPLINPAAIADRYLFIIERCDGPVIHFESVTKTYQNQSRPALESVDLDVEKGEFVFLVGPSGSGKSTFLRLILREERPTDGRIYVAGRDLARLTNWKVPQLRRRIGCVFQDFRLLPGKSVYQNIAFALEVIGKPRRFIRKVVPEVIDLVGLEGKGDRMPDELSGGEQQRVAMARAFVNRPMILLADEPTGNIDPATSIGIMKVLDRINRTGTTVVMATHDAAIVDSMRKRVIELEYGKVVRDQNRGVYGQAY
jgi:cell division transport system ATP-binding protein